MSTAATKRRVGVISTVVVALVASLLVWIATRSEGEIVRKADLNDGGIWVTNAEQARFGRINKPAGQLDAGVLSDGSTGSGLDVFQDGAAIVGYSKASNQIVPINPAEGTLAPEQSIVVPKPSTATGNRVFTAPLVDVRGGTIAHDRPGEGRGAGAARRQPRGDRRPRRPPDPGQAARQGRRQRRRRRRGRRHGVCRVRRAGHDHRAAPAGDAFATPVTTKLGFTSKSAQVTAVGAHWVVWDSGTGKLYSDALSEPQQLSVGNAEPGNPAFAALQQPGPDAASVLIQDEAQLTQVSLTGDSPTTGGVKLSQGAPGQRLFLSAPVRLASCVHAAWAGPPTSTTAATAAHPPTPPPSTSVR